MKDFFANISLNKTAIISGIGFLLMFIIAFTGMPFYQNLLVPGDEAATVSNIMANLSQFRIGVASYLIVLILDVVVAVGLYLVFKQVNKNIALLQMWLRLIYTAIALISLIVLVLLYVNAYNLAQLIAYAFFIPHVFVLGYLVYKSGYMPRIIGILLIIASFCYVILLYGVFILPQNVLQASLLIFIALAIIGELSIGIGLIWQGVRKEIPEMKS